MKYLKMILLPVILILAACTTTSPYGPRQTTGGMAGAALGGLLGAQFGHGSSQAASTAVGVLVGALIGSEVGRSMDDVDRMRANEAVVRAQTAPLGERISWNNPNNGHSGTIVPNRDGHSESGNYCREFYQTVNIDGREEGAYGVACRQPDGTWRIVQEN